MWAVVVLALLSFVLASPEDFDAITKGVELPLVAKKITMGQTVNRNELNVYLLTSRLISTQKYDLIRWRT
jgi:hypothetical protein